MNAALLASATLLGLAGAPHCAAMCGAACGALGGRAGSGRNIVFHAARLAGYAAAGALAAASVDALSLLGSWSPALRPLWTLLHAAALALGLWLLRTGRQPAWLESIGRGSRGPALPGGWQRLQGPARSALAGGLWVAWPCGLLQSAIVVSALADSPAGGAAAMAGFAAASALGLQAAPWLWLRLGGTLAAGTWAVRAAGALLVCGSGWALGHGLWAQWLAYCVT